MIGLGCGKESEGNSALKIGSDVEFGENDYQNITTASNTFGFQLLNEIEAERDENIFISPLSAFMALSMVYNGALGETKEEMAKTLHVSGISVEQLNKANASLMAKLYEHTTQAELQIANSLWLNEDYHFKEAFQTNNETYFNAEMKYFDLDDPQAPEKINKWASDKTNEKIKEIIEPPLHRDLVSVIMNAIYFQGDWTYPFEKSMTEDTSFYLSDGTTSSVSMMSLNEKLEYMENDVFQAVRLPYGEDDDRQLTMKIFLPKEDVGIAGMEKEWTADNWKAWNNSFNTSQGTLKLPRFQVEYGVELKDALKKLGMSSAFTRDANFKDMITRDDIPLWIHKVTQKTFLDVNEEGTEAAAVTKVEMITESALVDEPFVMEVNRPFYVVIADEELDVILFMGKIVNPES